MKVYVAGFGVACTISTECNNLIGLTCPSTSSTSNCATLAANSCDCPSGYYYDTTLQNCVALKLNGNSCSATCECKTSLLCVSGTCQCNYNYYWDGSLCIQKKGFGVACTISTECNNLIGLTCSSTSRSCQCPSGSQWFWSSSKNICAQCPVNWMIYGNHCYFIYEIGYSSVEAFELCHNQGATLMSVNDQAEFNFLVNVYNQRYGNGNLLLGAAKNYVENLFFWNDGSSSSNTSPWWCSGEPNNAGGHEDLLVLYKWQNVGPCLMDVPGGFKAYFICERDSY